MKRRKKKRPDVRKTWPYQRAQLVAYLHGCDRRGLVTACVTLLRKVRALAEANERLSADNKSKITEIARLDGQLASCLASRGKVLAEKENLRRRLERLRRVDGETT